MSSEPAKTHVLDLTIEELRARFADLGLPPYRANQVFQWIYPKRQTDFDAMTDLGKPLRRDLADRYAILTAGERDCRQSRDGTIKLLLEFPGDQQVEAVLIPDGRRLTACLSTQFGCPVQCRFCATGRPDFTGQATTGQIVEQLLYLQIHADRRITNVVLMGMGEPLLNYENVVKAVRIINAPTAFHIAARHITVSTIGIPPAIRRLAQEGLQITLAISLHAADQTLREQLIPLAKQFPLPDVIAAAQYYFQQTGREITLEYLMLARVNVSTAYAVALADLAQQVRANVNLIPYNDIDDARFEPPHASAVKNFVQQLRRRRVNVNLRSRKGADIDAACGQLKKRHDG